MDGYEPHYYVTFSRDPPVVSKYIFMSFESLVRLSRTLFVVCFLDLLATSEAHWASFPVSFPSLVVTYRAHRGSSLECFCLLQHAIFCLMVYDVHAS
jgi:hypothetical protein